MPGCCMGTTAQVVPSKCSASAEVVPVVVLTVVPTTQMSVAELAEMDSSAPALKSGSGMVTGLHAGAVPVRQERAAASDADGPGVAGAQVGHAVQLRGRALDDQRGFTDQADPFQCSISVP